ncbi:hypothetical protein, partial [Neisseria meningitidis]|uniref:hypothetical protein n=1 Tax=Neisseria meningitidis TaxID=487 RepID=UPI001C994B2E
KVKKTRANYSQTGLEKWHRPDDGDARLAGWETSRPPRMGAIRSKASPLTNTADAQAASNP